MKKKKLNLEKIILNDLRFDPETKLIPVIVQDSQTQEILMHAYMNQDSLKITLKTNKVTFFSRSRKSLWTKGETSGHFLNLVSITTDCDRDALLIKAIPDGPTCHLGTQSCFQNAILNRQQSGVQDFKFLSELEDIIGNRLNKKNKKKSYVRSLFESGQDKIIQKVGEEAIETLIAAKNTENSEFIYESADLIFHLLVLLKYKNLSLNDIVLELKNRNKK